jgi:hypothetical protein
MAKPLALAAIFLATLAIFGAYLSAFLPGGTPGWAPWVLAMGIAVVLPATMVIGAERNGQIGRLAIPFGFTFLVIAVGFGAVLALPPADPLDPTLWLGLPPRAAIVMYGIGLLPFFVVPVAYALTFDRRTLSEADLQRVREAAREFQARSAPAAPAPERIEVRRTEGVA